MTEALLDLNLAVTAAVLVAGLFRRGAYLTFPFVAALTCAAWYLPQAASAISHDDVPEHGKQILFIMSLLCQLATLLGWINGRSAAARMAAPVRTAGNTALGEDEFSKYLLPVAALTAATIVLEMLIRQQPDDIRAGAWSGPITILAFFRSAGKVALAASLVLVLNRRTAATMFLFAVNAALEAPSLFIEFRRIDVIDVAFAIAGSLWLVKGMAIPRLVVVIVGLGGFFFVHAVGELRAVGGAYSLDSNGQITTRLPTWDDVSKIDWFASNPLAEGSKTFEVDNAATFMAVATDGSLTLGGQLWNRLVHAYVPGQLIGFENKQALMLGVSLQEIAFTEMGYDWHVGTTSTGFVECYQDFWFFGAGAFYLLAFLMAHQYTRMMRGDVISALLYMSGLGFALHSFTHGSYYYFVNMPIVALAVVFIRRTVEKQPRMIRDFGAPYLPTGAPR